MITIRSYFYFSSKSLQQTKLRRHKKPKIDASLRICRKCQTGEIEDEFHFLIICSHYNSERAELLSVFQNIYPMFDLSMKHELFKIFMTSKNKDLLNAIGKYLCKCDKYSTS